MTLKMDFEAARISGLVLAKVGNPQRDEPLQTSRQVLRVEEEDQALLTSIFLKPFRNLAGQRFRHHSALAMHEMNTCAKAIFTAPEGLLEGSNRMAKDALAYFDDRKHFSLAEFEEQALRTPEARARFAAERRRLEQEEGVKFDQDFDISKRDVSKARKLVKSVMKLDTSVEIRLRPKVVDKPESVLETGYDETRGMKFIKVFFNRDLLG